MKIWIPMLLLLFSVAGLCVWDGLYTTNIFNHLSKESDQIYHELLHTSIEDENIKSSIINLNDYWTKKMDTLCISISRKDLQPVSDFLQYLYACTINNNQEDAITYSRLLYYNALGLQETTGISVTNLL